MALFELLQEVEPLKPVRDAAIDAAKTQTSTATCYPRAIDQLAAHTHRGKQYSLMEAAESSLSFVIRIWLEETAEEAGQAMWRGHLTHVPSGQRRYFASLPRLSELLTPYLEELGADPDGAASEPSAPCPAHAPRKTAP